MNCLIFLPLEKPYLSHNLEDSTKLYLCHSELFNILKVMIQKCWWGIFSLYLSEGISKSFAQKQPYSQTKFTKNIILAFHISNKSLHIIRQIFILENCWMSGRKSGSLWHLAGPTPLEYLPCTSVSREVLPGQGRQVMTGKLQWHGQKELIWSGLGNGTHIEQLYCWKWQY